MITRRRFLAISAASLASPARATPFRWRGHALGAEVSLTLDADISQARTVMTQVRNALAECENLFSLYRPHSALSRLNRDGFVAAPDARFYRLLRHCDRMHAVTGGRFDPTVHTLWTAHARGQDIAAARMAVGWSRVGLDRGRISLGEGQGLTLNGIAQGFATDWVADLLHEAGLKNILVNIGEFHAGGRYWTLGISDPERGLVATRKLKDRAVATSSPGAMLLADGQSHIVNTIGTRNPVWSTVSVEATDATTADALSTAFCHATPTEIAAMVKRTPGNPVAICVPTKGAIQTIYG